MLSKHITDQLSDGSATLEGFDDCIIGIGTSIPHMTCPVLIYSVDKIIASIMKEWGMELDEAEEYFSHNIFGSSMGVGSPIFCYTQIDNREDSHDLPK
tara:strand:+ start:229 stop:522 length:294 start_codon:yes stop_codon:yes gene_type:complete